MKNPEYVELYVCEDIRTLIEKNVQELGHVNRRLYANKLLYIVSKLHWKQIHHPQDFEKNGAKLRIHVNSEYRKIKPDAERSTLVWLLSSKGKKVTNMIKTLGEWGIIKLRHEEIIGVSARTYTFNDAFTDSQATLERFYDRDGAFVRRHLQVQADREQHPLLQEIRNIYQNNVTLSEDCLRYIEDQYGKYPVVRDIAEAHRKGCFDDNRESLLKAISGVKFAPEHQRLRKLFLKEYYASVGPRNGRVDHNLTNLERQFRRFVLIDGKPLVETDIVNCQPALAAGLINRQLRNMNGEHFVADDMKEYEGYCQRGVFYEVLAEKAGIPFNTPALREKFKEGYFYPEVFYCKNNNWNTKTQVAFRTLFPNADAAIRELKKADHRQFSIDLQKLESDVVVYTVFAQMLKEGHKALPLHDAIYTNDESVKQYAQQLIRQAIREKHGIEISFKGEVSMVEQNAVIDTAQLDEVKIAPISRDVAFGYFDIYVEWFAAECKRNGNLEEQFRHDTVLQYLRSQLHTSSPFSAVQRKQVEGYLVEFDRLLLKPHLAA